MKKIDFFPSRLDFLFKHSWILKTFLLLTLEWQGQRFPNFFCPTQVWVSWKRLAQQPKPQTYEKNDRIGDFGSKLLSSFLMSTFHSFLKYWHYRRGQTAVTLKMQNFGLCRLGTARFLTLRCPCLGFDRYFGNHWDRSANPSLCYVSATSVS